MGHQKEGPHSESLLRIPLIHQMLSDPHVRLKRRGIDNTWRYCGFVTAKLEGFNPSTGNVYYSSKSALARWLEDPDASVRPLNQDDWLVREALFACHDYLHCWSYQVIQSLLPELGFGYARITARNFEPFVFCHLLTEAVATVGLDYWFLSQTDLNRHCDVGTAVRGLTTRFRQEQESESRRYVSGLEVQCPEFFDKLVTAYCTGRFPGATPAALWLSPQTSAWLGHELAYGRKQREYIRLWLSHLSGFRLSRTGHGPVAMDAPWQRKLTREVGELLWMKVKTGREEIPRNRPERSWSAPSDAQPDFRFQNANRFARRELSRISRQRGFRDRFEHYFWQHLSRHDFEGFDMKLIPAIPTLLENRDYAALDSALSSQRRIPSRPDEPRDLFFLN